MEPQPFLGSSRAIEVVTSGVCRVCGHKSVEPVVTNSSVARLAVAFLLRLHP